MHETKAFVPARTAAAPPMDAITAVGYAVGWAFIAVGLVFLVLAMMP